MPLSFSVIYRNYGHWDIVNSQHDGLFRLRGGPGEWRVFDERPEYMRGSTMTFKEQSAAMSYICAELMHQLLTVEGQKPYVMESWNVSSTPPPFIYNGFEIRELPDGYVDCVSCTGTVMSTHNSVKKAIEWSRNETAPKAPVDA